MSMRWCYSIMAFMPDAKDTMAFDAYHFTGVFMSATRETAEAKAERICYRKFPHDSGWFGHSAMVGTTTNDDLVSLSDVQEYVP